MKKIILIAAFAAGLNVVSKAQNSLSVGIGADLCLNNLSVVYTDDTTAGFDLGCSGGYSFDIGSKTIKAILINGVFCDAGATTDVFVNSNVGAKATRHDDLFQSVINLIR